MYIKESKNSRGYFRCERLEITVMKMGELSFLQETNSCFNNSTENDSDGKRNERRVWQTVKDYYKRKNEWYGSEIQYGSNHEKQHSRKLALLWKVVLFKVMFDIFLLMWGRVWEHTSKELGIKSNKGMRVGFWTHKIVLEEDKCPKPIVI